MNRGELLIYKLVVNYVIIKMLINFVRLGAFGHIKKNYQHLKHVNIFTRMINNEITN